MHCNQNLIFFHTSKNSAKEKNLIANWDIHVHACIYMYECSYTFSELFRSLQLLLYVNLNLPTYSCFYINECKDDWKYTGIKSEGSE